MSVNQAVNEQAQADVAQVTQEVCYFSQQIGMMFANSDPIASNDAVLDMLQEVREHVDVDEEKGQTTFPVKAEKLGYFLHQVYCHTPDGKKVRVELDGIWPFEAPDENGVTQKFNAQLMSISEQPE